MLIKNLPTDNIPLTKEENDIVDWLFPNEEIEQNKIMDTSPNNNDSNVAIEEEKKYKYSNNYTYLKILVIGLIFYILNLNLIDNLIIKYTGFDKTYIVSLLKTIILVIILISIALIYKKS
jgi:hypothetical protein